MMKFNDRVTVGQVKQVEEGYLVATAKVARTGVQEYYASELGDVALSAGFNPSDVVRVYRHPDQVFAADTLNSITRVPVTVNHPIESVDANNWSKYAVGEVGDAYARDGDWIVVNPMIKDASAIEAARTTHKEISMGYTANIVKARDGIPADFEMKDIKMNHLALVPAGRAGKEARIGDSWGVAPLNDSTTGDKPTTESKKEDNMSDALKSVVLGDKVAQVAAADAAVIEQFKAEQKKALSDAESVISKKDEEIGTLKAELVKAQDAAKIDVDALVKARTELLAQVKAVDAAIEVAGKSDAELRKAAVVSKLGDAAVVGASDAEIAGMFKVLARDAKPADPVNTVFKAGVTTSVGDAYDKAQADYVARLTRQKTGA